MDGFEAAAMGSRRWAIAEGYIPAWSQGPEPEMRSHETLCLLNAGKVEAKVEIEVYFPDREPIGPYKVTVPPRRTLHLRMDALREPEPIPVGKDYACTLDSDQPIVVQHTRLDTRQEANALFSTIAFSKKG